MATLFHKYSNKDQMKILSFYETLYRCDNYLYGYLRVMWQCIQQYPSYPMFHHEESGIWEDKNQVVGMVHLSGPGLGNVSIDIHPEYMELFDDMVAYAEKKFCGTNREGNRYIRTSSPETIPSADKVLKKHHFEKCGTGNLFYRNVEKDMEEEQMPLGFQKRCLDEVYDFDKLSRLIWDALHYPGEPPRFHDDIYLPVKQAWFQYQKELCPVILDKYGNYAAFCGVWFDQSTKVTYIEPLVCGSGYQNMGLEQICIQEMIKNCIEIGANTIFIIPSLENRKILENAGFQTLKLENWMKIWNQC